MTKSSVSSVSAPSSELSAVIRAGLTSDKGNTYQNSCLRLLGVCEEEGECIHGIECALMELDVEYDAKEGSKKSGTDGKQGRDHGGE